MTKYVYKDKYRDRYLPGGRKTAVANEQIRRAIKIALDAPIVSPSAINSWTLEELQRYNRNIKTVRRIIGSYLR